MDRISLSGLWKLRIIGENVYRISGDFMDAQVPGSVYGTLLQAGMMPDPFYRENELDALKLMENDFEYVTTVEVTRDMLRADALLLHFDGIDTLADIYMNGTFLGHTDNMHRQWEFDILSCVRTGQNELRVALHSPSRYCREENEKVFTGGETDTLLGFPHLRKAHCMLGWDWGPRLPDAGIFRDVALLAVNQARFSSVRITQKHERNRVRLVFETEAERFTGKNCEEADGDECMVDVRVTAPDGSSGVWTADGKNPAVTIENPRLWWPHGYGEQPLYSVEVTLTAPDGRLLDVWERRIGLRTMTVDTQKDEWGERFAHVVNGLAVFAMGADYIPEDNIFGRITEERTRRLLEDCIAANHNTVRVWGGGYYPDDYFYDICDELGLIVWQDCMFACASYELTEEFEENIRAEIRDNVRRIRHHACLGLWAGNNEMEAQVMEKEWSPSMKQTGDYIRIFEYIIPKVIKEEAPQTFYWPSSPSSGGNFDNPNDENRGDAHYWQVWHGNQPFTAYRSYYFRYLSEFGFQSFPCLRTVESFTEEEDRNIFSRVMEMHQRGRGANGKILSYLAAMYLYPKDFARLLYASQLLQADAIRYGVEHFRRHRGRCMGTVVWQLNDIWPTASWSSIDYYGRWKALHYAEKKAFAPVMISCEEKGEISERPYCIAEPAPIEKSARLHVANETGREVTGEVRWRLCGPDSAVIFEGSNSVTVPAFSGVWLDRLDFSDQDELSMNFGYGFYVDGEAVSENHCLFTAPKHYRYLDPQLSCSVQGDELTVTARAFAQKVEIEGTDADAWLSDNFFDMQAGEKKVRIERGQAKTFTVKSVYDIAH